jgi:hypothetical protein
MQLVTPFACTAILNADKFTAMQLLKSSIDSKIFMGTASTGTDDETVWKGTPLLGRSNGDLALYTVLPSPPPECQAPHQEPESSVAGP